MCIRDRPSVVPGLVLRPTSTEQLGALIERCYANGLPMTIRGAGTNLSGGTVPDADKSVVILTQGLNKIIEINEEDLFAIVEPGVEMCIRDRGNTVPAGW